MKKCDTIHGFWAPKPIASDAQNERYIAALLAMERRNKPSPAEKHFAELLTLLIEIYEEKHYPMRVKT